MKDIIEWWKEFFKRLTLPAPKWWVKFRNYMVFFGTVCLIGWGLPIIPDVWKNIFGHAFTYFFLAAAVSQLVRKDPSEVKFENDFD